MPLIVPEHEDQLKSYGFRKVWHFNHGIDKAHIDLDELTFEQYINCDPWTNGVHNKECPHFAIDWKSFYFEVMNCMIVAIIMLQCEIFSSFGYLKYVTQ